MDPVEGLTPFVPRAALAWAHEPGAAAGPRWRALPGSMVFADISGFTKMSERLARHGKVGAEEVTDAINSCFEELLAVAYDAGGQLLKFGGDALLLYFLGPGHERRAVRAAAGMRARLRQVGRLQTSAGQVTLRISMGVHSGTFHAFLVGTSHREFVVAGPSVTTVVGCEGLASAGEIVLSAACAAALPRACSGRPRGDGVLLRTPPPEEPLAEDAGAPAPSLELTGLDASRLLPTAVREHLAESTVEPEHRRATVAFVHFEDTDHVLETEGPEELAGRLDVLVGLAQRAADDLHVTFLATDVDADGGKIILTAGVPRRFGDDEERLLVALRRIVDARPPMPVRVGIHVGAVFAAAVGPPFRRTYTVMGDTVNLAARLMARASAGQILATPAVVDRARRGFDTTALEPFTVKGKRKPVEAVAIGAARRAGAIGAHLLPLVGRHEELATLEAELDAAAGAVRLAEIVGEPGLGKTRLVEELRRRHGDRRFVTIACEEYDWGTPYAPFRRLGLHLLGLHEDFPVHEVLDALRHRVEREAPELGAVLPLVAAPFGIDLPDTPDTASLEPEFRRRRTELFTAGFLAGLLPPGAVVVLEDVHNMDEASFGLLDDLLRQPELAALFVLTRRDGQPSEPPALRTPARLLRLEPLTEQAATDALVGATGEDPLLPHELRLLTARAAGNPLFLESLLGARRQGAAMDDLPLTVEGVVHAKIDRLSTQHRAVLRSAAVLGLWFTVKELGDLLGPDDRSFGEEVVNDLEEFLVREPDGTLRFRWELARDCAYETLPYRRRRELHGRAAQSILERAASDADVEAKGELLSMHFFHAGSFGEAWQHAMSAGRRAAARYANAEAGVLFERAIAAARRLGSLDALELSGAWESLGDARDRAGSYDGAAGAYRTARRLAKAAAPVQARICLKQSQLTENRGRMADAVRWVRRGLEVLEEEPGPEAGAERARLLANYGVMRQTQRRHREAIRWCEVAIAEARRYACKDAEARALNMLDWAWVALGEHARATNSARALALYTELGDLRGQFWVLNNMGGLAYFMGRWDEAVACYEQSRELVLATGDEVRAAYGLGNVGEVLADQGHYDDAARAVDEARRLWAAAGDQSGTGFAHMILGRIAARTGRAEEARAHLDNAREMLAAMGDEQDVRFARANWAEALALQGRAEEALAEIEDLLGGARASAEDAAGSGAGPSLLRTSGYALAQLGRPEEAVADFVRSIAAARAQGSDYELALSLTAMSRFHRRQGDEASADEHERESAPLLRGLGVVRVPEYPMRSRTESVSVGVAAAGGGG